MSKVELITSQLVTHLVEKMEQASTICILTNGGVLIKVEPAFTSQDCSCCNNRVKKSLSIRTHICAKCGTVLDRDYNAAINILQKAKEELLVTN